MSRLPPSVSVDSTNSRQHRGKLANAINGVIRYLSDERTVTTVSQLSTVGVDTGSRAVVTDATSSTFHAAPVGGGSTVVPVFWNGSAWLIG